MILPLPFPRLRSVIKYKDSERQLARWIEFLSSIDQDYDTRMLMHFNVDPVMTVVRGVMV